MSTCRDFAFAAVLVITTAMAPFCYASHAVETDKIEEEVIFSDDFDNQPDWWPSCLECGCTTSGCNDSANQKIPKGWSYWRNDELWNPYTKHGGTPGSHPTIQISGENHFGPGGKAFTVWNESNPGRSHDGWGADGILAKKFDKEYRELTAEVRIRFQKDFKWFWTPDQNAGVLKIFRVYHYDGGKKSPFKYFADGSCAPMYIFDLSQKEAPWDFRAAHSFRCKPQSTNYYCKPKYDGPSDFKNPTKGRFLETLGDGKWHLLKWQIIMNSVPGAPDGVLRFWADGRLQYEATDIKWLGPGSPSGVGWNVVALGGNAYNSYADSSFKREQWYALDDFIVTTRSDSPIKGDHESKKRQPEFSPKR